MGKEEDKGPMKERRVDGKPIDRNIYVSNPHVTFEFGFQSEYHMGRHDEGTSSKGNVATFNKSEFSILENPQFVPQRKLNVVGNRKPWSKVLKPKGKVERMKFEYHCHEVINGKVIIKPPLKVDIDGRKAWETCLVGYFFEKRDRKSVV